MWMVSRLSLELGREGCISWALATLEARLRPTRVMQPAPAPEPVPEPEPESESESWDLELELEP